MSTSNLTPDQKILVSTDEAAELYGLSKRHFLNLSESGQIGPCPVKMGRRSLYRRCELEAWAAAGCPSREIWQGREKC